MSGKISRRQFVGAAAGAAAATYFGGVQQALGKKEPKPGHDHGPGHGKPHDKGKRTVPPHMLGVQHFSLRDATARLSIAASARLGVPPTMGRLGGPDYPHDPNDLGPLVPLPGGYAEVFEYLASVDIMGFEFFQSTQSAQEFDPPRQPTAAEIRKYLDDAGLEAMGTHQFGPQNLNPQTMELFPADPSASPTAPGENLYNFLHTLGMKTMGFSGNVSNLSTLGDQVNPVTGAITYGFAARAQHVDRIGEILKHRGVKYFYHPEQDNYRFFADPAHPELDTVHRIQWVMENTDPKLFGWQIDVLHNWSGRVRFLNATTHQPDISVWALAQTQHKRVGGWHIKDGFRNTAPAGNVDGRPAGERRLAVLPDVPAHADVHGRGDLRGGRPRRRTRPGASQRRPGLPRIQVHVRESEGQPGAPPLRDRERQRPWRHVGPRPLASPREGVRSGAALLAREQEEVTGTTRGARATARPLSGRPVTTRPRSMSTSFSR